MKAKKSKRNRHTGRINAFKQDIIDNGDVFKIGATFYARKRDPDQRTIVRLY
jgi:hypothetical protein